MKERIQETYLKSISSLSASHRASRRLRGPILNLDARTVPLSRCRELTTPLASSQELGFTFGSGRTRPHVGSFPNTTEKCPKFLKTTILRVSLCFRGRQLYKQKAYIAVKIYDQNLEPERTQSKTTLCRNGRQPGSAPEGNQSQRACPD